jgi:hypothetical protein
VLLPERNDLTALIAFMSAKAGIQYARNINDRSRAIRITGSPLSRGIADTLCHQQANAKTKKAPQSGAVSICEKP